MVTLKQSMDRHSLDIFRDGKHLGYIQWHPERDPRIILAEAFSPMTISEVESTISQYKAYRARVG